MLVRTAPRLAAGLATFALAALASGPARAFERQWHVGATIGGGAFSSPSSAAGPAVGAYAGYGLSDMFDLRAQLTASRLAFSGASEGTWVSSASAGLAYKLDVIEWVPWADLQLGYYRIDGPAPGDRHANDVGASLGLGIDYAFSRDLGLGAELRYHGFLRDAPTSLADTPYLTGMFRVEYTWGF